jgi:phosphopantetheinyl transferase
VPIFFQQEIDADTKLAVWKIEEPEEFFTGHVMPQRNVTHPHKKLQHLAGRYLLKFLFKDFPTELIQIADTRKPFLEDEAFHFSISHCGDYAAALVSKINRVGVDVELISDKAEKIKHKFLTDEEWSLVSGEILNDRRQSARENIQHSTFNIQPSTLLWSCKEAVFKWHALGGIDFKNHIQIKSINRIGENQLQITVLFAKKEEVTIHLHAKFFDDVCLSWVIT